jgi:hypothetical protein
MALLSMVHLVYDGGHSMREVMAGATPALSSPPWTPDLEAPEDVPQDAWAAFQDGIANRYFTDFKFRYDDVLALAASCDPETHGVVMQAFTSGFQRVVNEVDATTKVAMAHRAAWEADGLVSQA